MATTVEVGVDVPTATDGGDGCRSVRRLAATPAARPGRARHGSGNLPPCHGHACWLTRPRAVGGGRGQPGWLRTVQVDLEQRREDVLGASQSGRRSSLRLLGVIRDEDIIRAARDSATALVDADPELARAPALRRSSRRCSRRSRRATWRSPRHAHRRGSAGGRRIAAPPDALPDQRRTGPAKPCSRRSRPCAGPSLERASSTYTPARAPSVWKLSVAARRRFARGIGPSGGPCAAPQRRRTRPRRRRSPRCLSSVSPPSRRRPLRTRPVPTSLSSTLRTRSPWTAWHGPPRSASQRLACRNRRRGRSSRSPDFTWPAGFHPKRSRRYGEGLWYGRAAMETSGSAGGDG